MRDTGQARYAPPTAARWPVILGLGLAYLAVWWIVSAYQARAGREGPTRAGQGRMQAFDLASARSAPARRAGHPDGAGRPAVIGHHDVAAPPVRGDPQGTARIGSSSDGTALAAAIADVLGDDPAAEGDMLGYRKRLLDHLRRFTHYPVDAGPRAAGVVVVRFRIARDGTVIDSRIVSTHNAVLDASALSAVWQASPLPAVPLALSAPCEIDVPIAFAAPGRLQRRA